MNGTAFRVSRRGCVATLAVLVGSAILALLYLASPVGAQEPTHGSSRDCFGGALSSDPIHCEVLEWAHNSGLIDVDGIYRAGRALYIYLNRTDGLDEGTLEKMLGRSREIARRTGEHKCLLAPILCGSGVLGSNRYGGYILPKSTVYQTIEVFPGGAQARRSSTGWQVFVPLWPGPTGAEGAAGTAGDFDISGVDRTNFPVLGGNCHSPGFDLDLVYEACDVWDDYPELRVANAHGDVWNDKVYFYVKAEAGEADEKEAAARRVLMAAHPAHYTDERLVVVTVPHDFEELWRWSLVLDRFANSSGNTIGVSWVGLGFNTLGGLDPDRKYLFPVADAPDLTDGTREDGFAGWSRWRLIIQVETLDFEKTLAHLPVLLRQLEIPESAVGLIFEKRHHLAERGTPVPGESYESNANRTIEADRSIQPDSGSPSWLVWVAVAAAGVLAASGLTLRAARGRQAADAEV